MLVDANGDQVKSGAIVYGTDLRRYQILSLHAIDPLVYCVDLQARDFAYVHVNKLGLDIID